MLVQQHTLSKIWLMKPESVLASLRSLITSTI